MKNALLLAAALTTPYAIANADKPAAPATAAALANFAKAAPNLKAAIECKSKLVLNDAVNTFVPGNADGVTLPAPLLIFGAKTTTINLIADNGRGGADYSALFYSTTLAQLAKAAKVKAPEYVRDMAWGGTLEVDEMLPGVTRVTCRYRTPNR